MVPSAAACKTAADGATSRTAAVAGLVGRVVAEDDRGFQPERAGRHRHRDGDLQRGQRSDGSATDAAT